MKNRPSLDTQPIGFLTSRPGKKQAGMGPTPTRRTRAVPPLKSRGELRSQYHHSVDIGPTIPDVVNLEMPKV